MHAIVWGATIRLAHPSHGKILIACRTVTGIRRPVLSRAFHRSVILRRVPEIPKTEDTSKTQDVTDAASTEATSVKAGSINPQNEPPSAETQEAVKEVPAKHRVKSEKDFAASRRAARNKRPREVPQLKLPNWFWESNVLCLGDVKSPDWTTRRRRRLVVIDPKQSTVDGPHAELLKETSLIVNEYIRNVQITKDGLEILTSLTVSDEEDNFNELRKQLANRRNARKLFSKALENFESLSDSPLALRRAEEITAIHTRLLRAREQFREISPTIEQKKGKDAMDLIQKMALAAILGKDNIPTVSKAAEANLYDIALLVKETVADKELSNSKLDKEMAYHINFAIYHEILASVRTGLTLTAPQKVDFKDLVRPDLLLQCPAEDGTTFLNEVVQKLASDVGADIVRLDSEDIAQIIGEYMGENIGWMRSQTSLLGYTSASTSGRLESPNAEKSEEGPGDDQTEPEMLSGKRPRGFQREQMENIVSLFTQSKRDEKSPSANSEQGIGDEYATMFNVLVPTPNEHSGASDESNQSSGKGAWYDFKLTAALESVISSAQKKRARLASADETEPVPSHADSTSLIVQINEYKELTRSTHGNRILGKLREVVKRRWHEGGNVMIVGTTTAKDVVPANSTKSITRLQSDVVHGDHRTIFIPPASAHNTQSKDAFLADDAKLMRDANLRHIESLLRTFLDLGSSERIDLTENYELAVAQRKAGQVESGDFDIDRTLSDSILGYPRVHRIASIMIGSQKEATADHSAGITTCKLDFIALYNTMKLLDDSDAVKFQWAKKQRTGENSKTRVAEYRLDKSNDEELQTIKKSGGGNGEKNQRKESPKKDKEWLDMIRKKCNPHETKLIGGVINPADIHTTFDDVRAPAQTVEALKTLTSLSLIRPEHFSYGVLATDKIPGLLLYGPPGTGKTLLAKAVAKQSGATVLEVSAAEINDMYVGEGEKNVKAVFSLAKKLSPCVVFLDEADALLGARGVQGRRSSHRELVNQFLREWDGMNDLSAFIMVATNRPFDIDEAVLRRLPRRLLVDLPLEKDREAILNIHLKGETLDPSVSLAALAHETPFYSGSDLKNLAVAAALACVREETQLAEAHKQKQNQTTNDEKSDPAPFQYAKKRTLTKAHFNTAMEEIGASISEDMSTLKQIRQFDERYGDKKGRKKRGAGLGFGGAATVEGDGDLGRVRRVVDAVV